MIMMKVMAGIRMSANVKFGKLEDSGLPFSWLFSGLSVRRLVSLDSYEDSFGKG